MPAMYPLDTKEELELMHKGVCYLKSIGISYDALDGLLDAPPGAVRSWILREADGFHPLLINGWYKPKFWLTMILCSLLGVWDGMEKEALEKIARDNAWEQRNEYWKGFCKDILSLGGVSAFKGGFQSEDVTVIPNKLIRWSGLQPDRISQILADYFPCYGVETEQGFYEICELYDNFLAAERLIKGRL